MNKVASVSELKAKLSSYLNHVRSSGDEVIVTDRGRPVARLSRLDVSPEIEDLVAAGILMPAKSVEPLPDDFWENMPEDPEGLFLKALLAEREEAPY